MAMPCATIASGLQVSKLCLGTFAVQFSMLPRVLEYSWFNDFISGTMTYGEQNTFEEACQQLNMAREAGVNFFDAAEM